jgi:Protein of unknown function (DUF2723)
MKYKNLNNITGWVAFAFSLIMYLLTVAPTASFWDCGEFISCSNELEVPHPPGAPFFLILGRVFAMFAGAPENVAYMVNLVSALSSAFTVLFTFWIVTILAKKMVADKDENPTMTQTIVILGAGLVGAWACAFSDSFWFSAVEAEVYAMSSFFTAIVIWAMLKWEARADEPGHQRWLVLIAYLMGLSIGVHLLNLLTIPALGLIYYFKKYKFSWTTLAYSVGISIVILAVIQFGIILATFDIAWVFEKTFVGTIKGTVETGWGLPAGSGLIFTGLLLAAGLIYLVYFSVKKENALLNTIGMSIIVIFVGFASYTMIPIRSAANAPIDENDPETVNSFISYMKREQYGEFPVFKGVLYNSQPIDAEETGKEYITDEKTGKYREIGNKIRYKYSPADSKLFPRMWDRSRYNAGPHGYSHYVKNKGATASPMDDKPTGAEDISFLWNYQVIHMYFRYFMWNFAGRENDVQDCGWESGLDFSKTAKMPEFIKKDPAKNHYFMIPLILGLLGLYWHVKKDPKNAGVVGMLFFFTGLAIILYLNQVPQQPRERDYAFVGSFQTFCIWIGLSVIALYQLLQKYLKESAAYAGVAIGMVAPVLMLAENFDDHSRANNYTCPDSAYNLLNSLAPNAVLFTNGDNDTFPLWYAQEVEGIRPDVRVLCLSYVNTDWYINHMKLKMNESEPLPITMKKEEYTGARQQAKFFNTPTIEKRLMSNKNQMLADNTMVWKITTRKEGGDDQRLLYLADLLIINLIENVAKEGWKRPVYFANTVAPSSFVGLDKFLRQEGLAYRILPINKPEDVDPYEGFQGSMRADMMEDAMVNKFKYRNLDNPKVYYDENTLRMMGNYYNTFSRLIKYHVDKADRATVKDSTGKVLATNGNPEEHKAKAKKLLEFVEQKLPYKTLNPDSYLLVKMGIQYDRLGMKDKSKEYFDTAMKRTKETLSYYDSMHEYYSKEDTELASASVLLNYYNQTRQVDKLKEVEAYFGPMLDKLRQ